MDFECPYCHSELEADDTASGTTAACPQCGESISIPSVPPVLPVPTPEPAKPDTPIGKATGKGKTKQVYTIILYDVPVNTMPKREALDAKKAEMLRMSFVATSRSKADDQFFKWIEAEILKPECNHWLKAICKREELRNHKATDVSDGHFYIGNGSGN